MRGSALLLQTQLAMKLQEVLNVEQLVDSSSDSEFFAEFYSHKIRTIHLLAQDLCFAWCDSICNPVSMCYRILVLGRYGNEICHSSTFILQFQSQLQDLSWKLRKKIFFSHKICHIFLCMNHFFISSMLVRRGLVRK